MGDVTVDPEVVSKWKNTLYGPDRLPCPTTYTESNKPPFTYTLQVYI